MQVSTVQKVPDTCYEFVFGHERHAILQGVFASHCENKGRGCIESS